MLLSFEQIFLVFLLLCPLPFVTIICFIKKSETIKRIGLFLSSVLFCLSLVLWGMFEKTEQSFQTNLDINWNNFFSFSIGLDGISLVFCLLTTFLFFLCFLISFQSVSKNPREYTVSLVLLEFFLLLVFCVKDLFLFYIFFESVLIPMFIVIGVWGSRERKIRAAYIFFLYTMVGSLLMLLGIIYIYSSIGSTDYDLLLLYKFSELEQKWLWLAFFASFASKVPMLPLHIWLPEAHVEAPTTGSVILAGILLKLGTYGLIRYSLAIFPDASLFFSPFVIALAVLGVVYTSLTAIRQTDLKRIIAYTSVAHMNLVVLGIFSFNLLGLEGSIFQSLSHGFVSSALFLIIGVLYDRHHSRMLKYFSGLVHLMPVFSLYFLFFTMANIALPGTSSFVGEFLILCGVLTYNSVGGFFSASGMILGGAYSLWLYNRVCYGNLKTQYIANFKDINLLELCTLTPLLLITLFSGIYPSLFISIFHTNTTYLLSFLS